ncbi:MAG: nuclear transport factor 2 family protein [Acidobacteriota bacterium]
MDEQAVGRRNKETVRTFFRRLEEENIAGFLELFARDGRQLNPYASGFFPEAVDGIDSLREYWEPVPRRFDGLRFTIDELRATEDPRLVFVRYRGRLGLPDGGVYENDDYSTFRFDTDGKISEYVEIFNPIVAARAFGLMDEPADEPSVRSQEDPVANVVAQFFAAVDDGDWAGASQLMTNPFHLDYTSFGAESARELAPETVLEGWQQVLPGFEHTHHQIGNLRIEMRSKDAEARSYVTATHQIGERVWTVVGSYEVSLRRSGSTWKLSGLRFLFKYQTGDLELAAEASQRAESQLS